MQNISSRRAFRLAAFALAAALVCALALVGLQPSPAFAVVSSVKTAEVAPSYPNPITGEIEDPGDPNMVAMAESMMEGVTFPYALVETDVDGNVFVSLRFNLADQENGVTMEASTDGAEYVAAPGEMVASNAEDNTADWRFQVPAGTQYLRSHLGVIPIEREVIYFLTLGNSIDGNSAGFTQTVTPGEGAEDPEPAATAADEAAASEAPAAEAEPATTDDAAPAAGESAETGIAEYNAEGRDVTGGVDEQPGLEGGTIALVIAIIVAVAAVAGIVVFVAYVRPKRARQAAAAAAAAGTTTPRPTEAPAAPAKAESGADSPDEDAKGEDSRA
ncbi:heme-binding Shp domain-containing protein [Adlercreutzia sp. R25]|uniref:heme-binding Shp domain-containing protein n=1 Tax=Adlercreutzia shanghongiae TaxID=3111773 RepID=UPI002DBC4192|nr:heme-binding Shp domain-containing protein [Adlercreutzia sp. R25]MEC4273266.1 heme-binding Shp domain-containing protein [Adlercreutzia sp. R25]